MTDRSFGFLLAIICLIWAGVPLLHGGSPRLVLAGMALAPLLIAIVRPEMLAPLKRLWTRFGTIMHAGISFLALAAIYYLAITPGGLLLKACGRRRVSATFDPKAASYWQTREDPPTDFTRPY